MKPNTMAGRILTATLVALFTFSTVPGFALSFQPLEPDGIDPGTYLSPDGISGPGEVVVGASLPPMLFFNGDAQAFIWTKAGGAVALGFLPGGIGSAAAGVSRDGKTVAGTSFASDGEGDIGGTVSEAFIWTEAGGMVGLGAIDPEDSGTSEALAISDDGATVVGSGTIGGPIDPSHAFRWTAATGIVDLGTLGGNASEADGVSADGDVVAGWSVNSSGDFQAFRWTREAGMTAVPFLPGDIFCTFATVSGNGRVVVGQSENSSGDTKRSFRWTKAEGNVDIGALASGQPTNVTAVSRDGSVIVG
ncbi:MAG TPA: hypothetical protein VII09_06365, partial [Opitutaceae bacterium]